MAVRSLLQLNLSKMSLTKGIFIGTSLAVTVVLSLFIKNKIEESKFSLLDKEMMIKILKRIRRKNFHVVKQIAIMASQIIQQMKTFDQNVIEQYLNQFQIPQKMQNNITLACQEFDIQVEHFNKSLQIYLQNGDKEILYRVQEGERDYEASIKGKLPQPRVVIPDFVNIEKLVQIQTKLVKSKYLSQIQNYKKMRGITKEQLIANPSLAQEIINPQIEEEKILQGAGLSVNDDPASAVFISALKRERNKVQLRTKILNLEKKHKQIFEKISGRMNTGKISDEELSLVEIELINA